MAGSVRRFFTNIICGCVYNKDKRKHLRVLLNSPVASYLRFIRKNSGEPLRKVKTFIGYQARNLLISVNDKYIYKFPLRRSDSHKLTMCEQRVVSALAPLSPIYVPPVHVYEHRGQLVRRYEYIDGYQLRQIPLDIAMANIDTLASQVARFMYVIGCADPDEIRDLKPTPDDAPGYMYGWTQGDITDNFLVDIRTMRVIAMIDWEDCRFGDFSQLLTQDRRSPQREFTAAVQREYDKLYHRKK